jgi:hypothetical protein
MCESLEGQTWRRAFNFFKASKLVGILKMGRSFSSMGGRRAQTRERTRRAARRRRVAPRMTNARRGFC